jgi:hypothetical protein
MPLRHAAGAAERHRDCEQLSAAPVRVRGAAAASGGGTPGGLTWGELCLQVSNQRLIAPACFESPRLSWAALASRAGHELELLSQRIGHTVRRARKTGGTRGVSLQYGVIGHVVLMRCKRPRRSRSAPVGAGNTGSALAPTLAEVGQMSATYPHDAAPGRKSPDITASSVGLVPAGLAVSICRSLAPASSFS